MDNFQDKLDGLNRDLAEIKLMRSEMTIEYRSFLDKALDYSHEIVKTFYAQTTIFLAIGIYILSNENFSNLLGSHFKILLKIDLIVFAVCFLSTMSIQVFLLFKKFDVLAFDEDSSKEERSETKGDVIFGIRVTLVPMISWSIGIFLGMIVLSKLILVI